MEEVTSSPRQYRPNRSVGSHTAKGNAAQRNTASVTGQPGELSTCPPHPEALPQSMMGTFTRLPWPAKITVKRIDPRPVRTFANISEAAEEPNHRAKASAKYWQLSKGGARLGKRGNSKINDA